MKERAIPDPPLAPTPPPRTRVSTTHPVEVQGVYRRILEKAPVQSRYVEVGSGQQVHVVEAGDGPPAVFLHGTGTCSISFLALLQQLRGIRGIAVDLPGSGLSDPIELARKTYREITVGWMERLLDALGLAETALAGSSGGGVWVLWYALARLERVRRLVLLGGAPLLPGTSVPPMLRVMSTPGVGEFMRRAMKPSREGVVQMMTNMGEGDTIGNYPDLIDSIVAGQSDPVQSKANLNEFRAFISPVFGYRRALQVRPEDLRHLNVPTLLVWGDHDPVGSAEVAKTVSDLIPDARLEVLPGGHAPWLGNLERTAELVSSFIR